jgi:hypothetical protein
MKPKQKTVTLWCYWYRFKPLPGGKATKYHKRWHLWSWCGPKKSAETIRRGATAYSHVGPMFKRQIQVPRP